MTRTNSRENKQKTKKNNENSNKKKKPKKNNKQRIIWRWRYRWNWNMKQYIREWRRGCTWCTWRWILAIFQSLLVTYLMNIYYYWFNPSFWLVAARPLKLTAQKRSKLQLAQDPIVCLEINHIRFFHPISSQPPQTIHGDLTHSRCILIHKCIYI